MHQDRLDVECLLQFFNTHGAEVTPGSDVVGEDLQFDRRAHQASLLAILSLEYESAGRAAQCGLAAAQRNLLSGICSAQLAQLGRRRVQMRTGSVRPRNS